MSYVGSTIKKMIDYFEGDVKRVEHALKVYGYSKCIGELEKLPEEKREILDLAAILHDIGIKESVRKYSSAAGHYQELEGPPVACELLREFSLSSEVLDRICFLIGHHHSYGKIDDIDFQILVEADFIVNISEDSINRSQVDTISQKYFKTQSGLAILNSLFNVKYN